MEDKKEAGGSTWVWVVAIGIAALLVVGFIVFLKQEVRDTIEKRTGKTKLLNKDGRVQKRIQMFLEVEKAGSLAAI